jgi:hypothetical protein
VSKRKMAGYLVIPSFIGIVGIYVPVIKDHLFASLSEARSYCRTLEPSYHCTIKALLPAKTGNRKVQQTGRLSRKKKKGNST